MGRNADLKLVRARVLERARALQKLTDFDSRQLAEVPGLPDEPDDGLTPRQRLAAGHLVAGQSVSATAAALGISRATLHHWKNDPNFKRVVAQKSGEALEAVSVRARSILLRCAARLERSTVGEMSFEQALRLVNCRRLWDIALLESRHEDADSRSRDTDKVESRSEETKSVRGTDGPADAAIDAKHSDEAARHESVPGGGTLQ